MVAVPIAVTAVIFIGTVLLVPAVLLAQAVVVGAASAGFGQPVVWAAVMGFRQPVDGVERQLRRLTQLQDGSRRAERKQGDRGRADPVTA